MNLGAIRRQIARIQTRLAASGNEEYVIARNSGMRGLRDAIAKAITATTEGQGSAERETKAGTPCLGPIATLRKALLEEQARRAELFALTPIEKLAEQPAITEEDEVCDIPMMSNPNALNE